MLFLYLLDASHRIRRDLQFIFFPVLLSRPLLSAQPRAVVAYFDTPHQLHNQAGRWELSSVFYFLFFIFLQILVPSESRECSNLTASVQMEGMLAMHVTEGLAHGLRANTRCSKRRRLLRG